MVYFSFHQAPHIRHSINIQETHPKTSDKVSTSWQKQGKKEEGIARNIYKEQANLNTVQNRLQMMDLM